LLRYLAGRGLISTALAEAPVYVKEPKLLPSSVLNHAQVKQVLKGVDTTNAAGYRDRAMLELAYSSGLRAGELLGLNVADVNLTEATAIVLGKGEKQRVVPIGKTAVRLVESYVRAVRPFLVRDPQETALFLDRNGQRLPYHRFLQMVHRYADKHELDVRVTPHTFRRSCTTELIRGGANLYHVKELLGHETLDTLKHYVKLTIDDLKKTHEKCHPRERGEG
jgi:integrase/recombinase XerD